MIFLDTSAVIMLLRGEVPPESILNETIGLSSIVEMELWLGVYHGGGKKERTRVASFLENVRIFEFDRSAALETAKVISDLWKRGKPIGDFDSQIAGHAMSLGLPLLTDNAKHFGRVEGLELLCWR
jgi:tRNA(fMet)-specific endonuclease VapC